MLLIIFWVLAVLSQISALCPNSRELYKEQIVGTRYEFIRSAFSLSKGDCVVDTVEAKDELHFKATISEIGQDGKQSVVNVESHISENDRKMLIINVQGSAVPYNAIALDNDFQILATCDGDDMLDLVVLTNDRVPSEEVVKRIKSELEKYENAPQLMPVRQNDC